MRILNLRAACLLTVAAFVCGCEQEAVPAPPARTETESTPATAEVVADASPEPAPVSAEAPAALPVTPPPGLAVTILTGEAPHDEAGHALAGVGDVNGDGLADLLIGAWANDAGGEDAGIAYLILGRREQLPATMSLASADAAFVGEQAGDYAGFAVAGAGDVNGDGLADLLIGATGNAPAGANSGAAYVILGRREADWGNRFSLAEADGKYFGQAGQFAAFSLAGGSDLNSDGLDDFLVGSPRLASGLVWAVFGRREGWGTPLPLHTNSVAMAGASPGAGAGYSVAAGGDADGDGVEDGLVGAWLQAGNEPELGAAHLLLGGSLEHRASAALASTECIVFGERPRDSFGHAVAFAGDVNGDSVADVIVGSPRSQGADFGNPHWAGRGVTSLLLGEAGRWTVSFSAASADATFVGEGPGDTSGHSVAGVLDINGDGLDEILIGAPSNDRAASNAGAAYLIRGRREGWRRHMPLSEADLRFTGRAANDKLGSSVTGLGDFNGDGRGDFAVGAHAADPAGTQSGEVHLVLSAAR